MSGKLNLRAFLRRSLLNLRIQRKLNMVIVVTCAAVLLLACVALFVFQSVHFRRELSRDLQTTAEMIAANSLGALIFKDQQAAVDVLASLQAKPHVTYARLEWKDGALFAQRGAAQLDTERSIGVRRDGVRAQGDLLLLAQPIVLEGDRLGTLYLEANTRAMHRSLLRLYGGISALVLLVSILVGFLLSNVLQRVISGPILQLAGKARAVAEEGDYSVRAEKVGEDEVGLLTDAFNQMLGQIQSDSESLRAINFELQCEIVERERTEVARQAADQRFRSLTESANDAIISIDFQGRITSWNKGARDMFGYEEGEILGEQVLKLLPSRHHASHLQRLDRLRHGDGLDEPSKISELYGLRNDQTELPIELSLYVWKTGQELYFGAIMRDITERKRVAQELEALNQRLQETSRQAGMAEVATGVLHNVGNVLNSVNVSATLVSERVETSKISNVVRLAGVLNAHAHNLADFVANTPQGRGLPSFVDSLSERLTKEQASQLRELETLRKNVDHIKEIVAMQQSYSKLSGLLESVSPAVLIEDAISMNTVYLAGEKIELIRDYGEVPNVDVDRHKVMQILINLIRNAKHALVEGRDADRQLTIRLSLLNPERVVMEVVDNGVGIPPENLTLVFRHGFTTKHDGHGFGLHSGANAAKEMGGTLRVKSAGVGQGATFTLELPVSAAVQAARAA